MNKLKDFVITMQKLVWKNEQDRKARAKQQHLTNGLAAPAVNAVTQMPNSQNNKQVVWHFAKPERCTKDLTAQGKNQAQVNFRGGKNDTRLA